MPRRREQERRMIMNGHCMFPKQLLDPPYLCLSTEAKFIYMLMLDRLSLSRKNGEQWEHNDETYIYFTVNEVCSRLRCQHGKATSVFRELEDSMLIRRDRQGLGKPHRVFIKTDLLHLDEKLSKKQKNGNPGCGISAPINTETINTDLIYTDPPIPRDPRVVEAVIKTNINYDVLCEELDTVYLDAIVKLIIDVFCGQTETISIGGAKRNLVDVCQRFLTLNDLHIRYVLATFLNSEKAIRSPRGFLLKVLYDAPLNLVFA